MIIRQVAQIAITRLRQPERGFALAKAGIWKHPGHLFPVRESMERTFLSALALALRC
jgi:hypothetical protein